MTEPQEALWHFGGQCGARDCQNCKMCQFDKMCQNCQKMCKAQKVSKSPKTAFSGLSQEFWMECVSECSVSARVTIQGPDRPRSLVQPSQLTPARSGPRSLAQLPKGPGKVPSVQGASQRSYKAQESFSVPRDVFRPSPGKTAIPALGNCAQDWKAHGFCSQKNSKLNFYFIYFDI